MKTFLNGEPIPPDYIERVSALCDGLDEITEDEEPELCVFDSTHYCWDCGWC